ncbi:sensor histidine kinase [Euzebya sp.]|uniref:sensor histidine kinase n=1 Tax=Euzebya sp. TaxID=1971409 RepID=UPI003518F7FF
MTDRASAALDRIRSSPPWLQDLVLAIAVSQADLVAVLFGNRSPGPWGTAPTPVAIVAVLLISLPLVFRRQNPDLTIMLTGFGAGLAGAFGIPIQALAPLVALYTVAAYTPLADTVVATGIFFAVTTGLALSQGGIALLYANTLIVLGVAIIGRIVQAYREQTEELAAHAAELERSREERASLAVRAERSRIAREMHDVLAHSTSVMVVQATGARRMLPAKPDQAAAALQVIEDTGRQSLGELRRMLGLLRDDDEVVPPTRPQPGLEDVTGLVEEFRLAGLQVELRVVGHLPAVDVAISLSGYRIVQEALTNVLKHAAATRTIVELRARDGALHLEVLDDGGRDRGHQPGGQGVRMESGGFGLVGMRERAALVGGRLEAGPRPGGGYRVAAVLPLDDHPSPVPEVAS